MYSSTQLQATLAELRQAPTVTASHVIKARETMDASHAAVLEAEAAIEQGQRNGARRDVLNDLYKKRLDLRQQEHDATKVFEEVNRRGGHLLAAEQEKQHRAEQEQKRVDFVAGLPADPARDAKEPDEAMMRKLRGMPRYGGSGI